MTFVFALDAAGLAGAITVAVVGCLLTGLVALHIMHRALRRQVIAVPVAPYFVAVTTVWALLLGFVAADSWAANNEARRILNEERSAIQRLEGLARIEALDLQPLAEGVAAYAAAVVEREWGSDRNRPRFKRSTPSPAAWATPRAFTRQRSREAAPQKIEALL